MKRIVFVTLLCAAISFEIRAQLQVKPLYALPFTYSVNQADVFSLMFNPASIAQLKASSAGISSERKFLLASLSTHTVLAGLVTATGNFGLKLNYGGNSSYNESQLGIAFAKKLGVKTFAGLGINYNSMHIAEGYGNATAIGFEIGLLCHLNEHWHAGIAAHNPLSGKFSKSQERLDAVYQFGIGYEASQQILFGLEIEKQEGRAVSINAGCC